MRTACLVLGSGDDVGHGVGTVVGLVSALRSSFLPGHTIMLADDADGT